MRETPGIIMVSAIAQHIWHDPPLPERLKGVELAVHTYLHGENHTLAYPYASTPPQQELYDWRRRHPNKFNLAHFALTLQAGENVLHRGYQALLEEHQHWWHDYWGRSAIELESGDEGGRKFEEWYYRSLYYLASNDRGALPPAEGGLVANSWFGKFHLEMHFWHVAGLLAANRPDCLRPSLEWYLEALPQAKKNAEAMGLRGAKYPYTQDGEFLRRMNPVLAESAEFVTSFLVENPATGQYELWPPMATCDETTDFDKVRNPAFELAEFKAALNIAIVASQLLQRDDERRRDWAYVRGHLAPIPNNGEV